MDKQTELPLNSNCPCDDGDCWAQCSFQYDVRKCSKEWWENTTQKVQQIETQMEKVLRWRSEGNLEFEELYRELLAEYAFWQAMIDLASPVSFIKFRNSKWQATIESLEHQINHNNFSDDDLIMYMLAIDKREVLKGEII